MEWVETTAKTVGEAEERVLDQLGVGRDEAEFELLEEPKSGLFGLLRGEARVRGRVRPATVRPKHDRRRGRNRSKDRRGSDQSAAPKPSTSRQESARSDSSSESKRPTTAARDSTSESSTGRSRGRNQQEQEQVDTVSPQQVGEAAVAFMDGLVEAFGADGTTELSIDGTELDVAVTGSELGLLVGPGGRTLNAVQDLARVAAQRRLGDHETRLRVDVGGYREKRRSALEAFTRQVAADVADSREAKALEPMTSADRKVVHDTVNSIDGVESRSDGDDPSRRVVIVPA